jgi:hypothetical protein
VQCILPVFILPYYSRERGARALEERLGMKGAIDRAASAPQGLAAVLDAQETGIAVENTQDSEQ